MKNTFYLFLIVFGFTLVSCGDDEPDVDCNDQNAVITFINQETNNYTQRFNNIDFMDPNACSEVKEILSDYIDAVDGLEDCLEGANKTQFQADIEEARDELDNLQC